VRRAGSLLAGVAASLAGVAAAAAVLHAREVRSPVPPDTDRLLYLRSGKTADRVFLSFDALAADVYWIRTIQHYGRDRHSTRPDRFALLQPLLDLTTTLDPAFNIAYRFGAIFLSMESPNGPGRSDQAIALLEKGLKANPNRWQYAHDIGFIHYWYTGDLPSAARWFERAAAMPGAPEWIRPLAGVTLAQGGDRQGARTLLRELMTSNEKYIREAAERGLAQVQALDDLDALAILLERVHQATGRYPADWIELAHNGVPGMPPRDPTGVEYAYDPATHAVALGAGSTLAPLPRGMSR
jgi:tetratricopeptide (TPR) repeat protein